MAAGHRKTGVWWDVNTCPVPASVNPHRVRSSIESALQKYLDGPCPITIYAVGNLDNVSPTFLKAISSSGILIRQTYTRMMDLGDLVGDWVDRNPPPANILLISGDNAWLNPLYLTEDAEYNILRATPRDCLSLFAKYKYACAQEWVWEDLLKENSGCVLKNSMLIIDDQPAWFCELCQFVTPSPICDDFINHLKSSNHKEELWSSLLISKDWNGKPYLLCEICEYPGYDAHNIAIHLKSSEHKDLLYTKDKTVLFCKFCEYNGFQEKDMAIHYNSEEHTHREIDYVLADGDRRRAAAIERRLAAIERRAAAEEKARKSRQRRGRRRREIRTRVRACPMGSWS